MLKNGNFEDPDPCYIQVLTLALEVPRILRAHWMTSIGSFLEDSLGHDIAHPKSGLKERKVHFGRTVHCCLPEKRKMIPQHIVEQVSVNCFVVQMCYLLMFFLKMVDILGFLPSIGRWKIFQKLMTCCSAGGATIAMQNAFVWRCNDFLALRFSEFLRCSENTTPWIYPQGSTLRNSHKWRFFGNLLLKM